VQEQELLKYAFNPRSRQELKDNIGIKDNEDFRKRYLKPMLDQGWLAPTNTSSLTAPNQQYYATSIGKELLEQLENDHSA